MPLQGLPFRSVLRFSNRLPATHTLWKQRLGQTRCCPDTKKQEDQELSDQPQASTSHTLSDRGTDPARRGGQVPLPLPQTGTAARTGWPALSKPHAWWQQSQEQPPSHWGLGSFPVPSCLKHKAKAGVRDRALVTLEMRRREVGECGVLSEVPGFAHQRLPGAPRGEGRPRPNRAFYRQRETDDIVGAQVEGTVQTRRNPQARKGRRPAQPGICTPRGGLDGAGHAASRGNFPAATATELTTQKLMSFWG